MRVEAHELAFIFGRRRARIRVQVSVRTYTPDRIRYCFLLLRHLACFYFVFDVFCCLAAFYSFYLLSATHTQSQTAYGITIERIHLFVFIVVFFVLLFFERNTNTYKYGSMATNPPWREYHLSLSRGLL